MDTDHAAPAPGIMVRLANIARATVRSVVDYALPPRCPGCGLIVANDDQFCPPCWQTLDFLDRPNCAACSIPLPQIATFAAGHDALCGACLAAPPPFRGAPAALAYGPIARTVALRLKYGRRLGHARLMAKLMHRRLPVSEHPVLLIPVPLHRWRLWSRGYNQAALIADHLARLSGASVDKYLLTRARATPSMRGLGRKARTAAVKGAFVVPGEASAIRERLAAHHVVLIDDVHASGATLSSCARALSRAGALQVSALTFARVVPDAALADGQDIDFAALDSDIKG